MYSIRSYHPKDSENLKKICIATASDIFRGKKITEKALVDVYCRYYIEQEPFMQNVDLKYYIQIRIMC